MKRLHRQTAAWMLVCAASALLGCTSLPVYTPAAGVPTAKVNVGSAWPTWMCIDGKPHAAQVPQDNTYLTVPASGAIEIGTRHRYDNGFTIFSCTPRIRFTPEAGKTYFLLFNIVEERCESQVFEETPDTPSGLSLVPSMRRPYQCAEFR